MVRWKLGLACGRIESGKVYKKTLRRGSIPGAAYESTGAQRRGLGSGRYGVTKRQREGWKWDHKEWDRANIGGEDPHHVFINLYKVSSANQVSTTHTGVAECLVSLLRSIAIDNQTTEDRWPVRTTGKTQHGWNVRRTKWETHLKT